jgi:hypothetical protein
MATSSPKKMMMTSRNGSIVGSGTKPPPS